MLCFRCGSHVKDDAESCWHCGADLTQRAKGSAQERVRPASRLFAIAYETGDLIAKRYRVKAMLGSGGAGVVYRVHDEEIDVDVAVKVIHGKLVQTDEERRLFAKQTTIARKLIHSNCIRIYDDGLDQERPYFTMQLLEGLTLRRIIDLRKEKGSVFTPAEVRPVFDQICQALLYAHRTTFHGNLKPDNVLVLPDLLKVTDFGLLSGLPRKPFLALQKPRGSNLRYLAPEVRLEVSELNRSVDMYSLGVILLEMLAGHVYDDKDPLSLEAASKSLALPLQSLIRSCLARSPQERPPSVDVFYSALAAASGAGATGDALTASIGLAVPLPGAAAEVQVQSVTEEPVHPRAVLAPSSPPTSPVVPGTPKSAQTPAVAPDESLSSASPATQRAVGDEHAASSAPKATPFASDQSDASATAASASESSVEVSEHLSVPLPDLSNLPSPSGQASEPNVSARSVSPLPSRSPEPASPATEGDSSTVVPSRPRRGPPYDEPTQRLEVAAQASNFDEALGDLLREPSMALQIDDDMIESESTARSQEVIAESPIVDVEDAESLHDSVFQDVDETLVGGQQRPASEAGFASAALPRLDSLDEIGSSAIELIEAPESMAASGEVSAKSLPSFPSARPGPAGTVAPSSSPAPSEVAASSSPVPLEPGGARSPVPLESGSSRSPVPLDSVSSRSPVPLESGSPRSPVPLELGASRSPAPLEPGGARSPVPLESGSSRSPVPLDSVSSRSPVPLESGSSRSPVPSEMALSGRPTGAASRATEAGGDAPETEPAQPPLGVDGLDGAPKTDPLPAPLPASALIPVVEPDPAADILPVADVPAAPLAEPISAAPEANPSLAAALAAPAPIPPVDPAENAASARESLAPPRGIVEAFRPPRAEVAPRSEGAPRPAHRPKGAGRPAVPPPASITHSAGNGVHSPTNGRAYGQGRPKKKKRPMTRPRMAAVQPSATPARAQGSVPVVVAAAPTSNRLVYFTIAASFLMIMLAFLAVLKITTDQQRQSQAEIEALREQLLQDKRTQRVLDAIGSKGPQGRVDETKGSASDGASTAAETRKKQPRSAIERDGKGTESSDAERSSRIRRDKRASRKADAPSQKKKSAAKAASVAASRGTPSSASGRPCPTGMKLIASGPFMMGAQDSDPERNFDDLPYRSVNVSAVCMDLYEYPNARGRAPKTQVTWKAAVAQCERRGKRLCTESEWEKACKGPSGFRYAYGNRWEEGLCNTKEGLNAREAASSGQFAGCRSRYGLIDMTGNVAEWTSTANGRRYVIKGGAADRPSYDSRCAARKRKKKGHRAPLLGFRCCQDPS